MRQSLYPTTEAEIEQLQKTKQSNLVPWNNITSALSQAPARFLYQFDGWTGILVEHTSLCSPTILKNTYPFENVTDII